MNRSTVYRYWWLEHARSGDVVHTVFGHGPGFSSFSTISRGDIPKAVQYRGYAIGLTGISTLLWDTGLLGTCTFLGVLFIAYRLGSRLATQWRGTLHEPTILAAQISIALFATSLLHNEYVSFDIGFQTMLAMALGYLFAMANVPREDTP